MELLQVLANSLLGMAVVFMVLIVLMGSVLLMSKFTKKAKTAPAAEAPAAPAAPRAAKGSCGEVKLFDVPEKTAAMLMAITADKMNAPLNTLRFISIKEVK